jgi:hypothetical protein
MLGLFGHLGIFGDIYFGLAAAGYLALIGLWFRGLLLPALPRRPGGRVRRSLQVSSYLPRGFCLVYRSYPATPLPAQTSPTLLGCARIWHTTSLVIIEYLPLSHIVE